MDDLQDYDQELGTRIRHFLAKDVNFRQPEFDPAPYLIKVLKEKQANQQLLVEKQTQLIQLQNEAQELILEVVTQRSEDFFQVLKLPAQFGGELQKLKHGMAKVKRKVRQTKGLLLATQKDIKQIHLNCMFNKLIYQRLKQIELKLQQYEASSLSLKNHLYFECALSLPTFSSTSTLESALSVRTEHLKLRFLSQAIEQVRLFLYFTPRLSIPTRHKFLERQENHQQAFDQSTHSAFYKRYQLFCKARCEDYLSSIWGLASLEERSGKVATIEGIIKGIMRIGKANDITDSLALDAKKSIANIFSVLYYFLVKDLNISKDQQYKSPFSRKKKWLTSPDTQIHTTFLSAFFCISAALIRKMVIVRRICSDYQLDDVCNRLASQRILQIIRDQLLNFISQVYFTEGEDLSESADYPLIKLREKSSFVFWPYFKHKIQNRFGILADQLAQVEKSLFGKNFPDSYHYLKPFGLLQKKFNDFFHSSILKQFQSIFPQGRGLIPQNYDSILASHTYQPQQIQFYAKYQTDDRKGLRQYINLLSLLTSLRLYFDSNHHDPERLRTYSTFLLAFFYLKTNSAVFRSLISPSAYDRIIDKRLKDGKVINKEKVIQANLSPLAVRKDKHKVQKKFKIIEGDSVPLRNAEQLKMVRTQLQMLLYFCLQHLSPTTFALTSPLTDKAEQQIDKHEPSNYDDNIPAKLIRVWQQLVRGSGEGEGLQSLLAAILRRLLDLYLTLQAGVYLETGSF